MRILLDHISEISIEQYNDKTSLLADLRNVSSSLLLGDGAEFETNYYCLHFYQRDTIIGIGIICEQSAIKPQVLYVPQFQSLVIGYNRTVSFLTLVSSVQTLDINLNSIFYQMYLLNDKIIAIHELGLVELSYRGKELRRYDCDVVEDFKISDTELVLLTMDGATHKFDL